MYYNKNRNKALKYAPPIKAGNLYYVRLRTPVGLLYKLGFTTMNSVESRLAFKGDGADLLIDKVLLFAYFDDAWDMEQSLHLTFSNRRGFCGWENGMPLYKNGQSELYCDDVLRLDFEFTSRQLRETNDEIMIRRRLNGEAEEAEMRQGIRIARENSFGGNLQRAADSLDPDHQPGWVVRSVSWILIGAVSVFGDLMESLLRLSDTDAQKQIVPFRDELKLAWQIERKEQLEAEEVIHSNAWVTQLEEDTRMRKLIEQSRLETRVSETNAVKKS